MGSLQQLRKINLGFKPENLMTMRLSLPDAKYTDAKGGDLFHATYPKMLNPSRRYWPSVWAPTAL